MKHRIICVLVFMGLFGSNGVLADEIDIESGVDFYQYGSTFPGVGVGGDLRSIFNLDPRFGIGADLGYHRLNYVNAGPEISVGRFELIGAAKYAVINNDHFQLYFLGGLGFFMQGGYNNSWSDLMVQVGIGAEYFLERNLGLLVECKADDSPKNVDASGNVMAGNDPITNFPVSLGIFLHL